MYVVLVPLRHLQKNLCLGDRYARYKSSLATGHDPSTVVSLLSGSICLNWTPGGTSGVTVDNWETIYVMGQVSKTIMVSWNGTSSTSTRLGLIHRISFRWHQDTFLSAVISERRTDKTEPTSNPFGSLLRIDERLPS